MQIFGVITLLVGFLPLFLLSKINKINRKESVIKNN